jgi:hypothetical protein
MIERITEVFNRNTSIEKRAGVWEHCYGYYSQVPMTVENLEVMSHTNMVYGFFGGTGDGTLDREVVVRLAKAVGVLGINNPEGNSDVIPKINYERKDLSVSELLNLMDDVIGFHIDLPPFTGGRTYLKTDRGMISLRHCHYLWIMKRIVELFPDHNSSIIEIGAGMGWLGYFLDKAGYKDYTSIDLANANACQTYFLSKNLPERNIILSGDVVNPFHDDYKNCLKLLHYTDFKDIKRDRFNLMINTDGLTEMGVDVATEYMKSDCAPLLLSINHELNEFRIIDIYKPYRKLKYRYPFWLRDGYVEELYERVD